MSLSSCRVMSACSRAFSQQASTHIANRRILVDTRLQVLEYRWINAGHSCSFATLQWNVSTVMVGVSVGETVASDVVPRKQRPRKFAAQRANKQLATSSCFPHTLLEKTL
jgi:hypothetical protein